MTARSFLHVAHVWGNASRRAAWLERSTSNWREARRHAARRRHYEIAALNMLKYILNAYRLVPKEKWIGAKTVSLKNVPSGADTYL